MGEVGKAEDEEEEGPPKEGEEGLNEALKDGEGPEAMNDAGRGRGRIMDEGRVREAVGEGDMGGKRAEDLVGEGPRGDGRPAEIDMLLE